MSLIGKYLNLSPMITPTKGGSFGFGGFGGSKSITIDNAMQHTTVFACNRVIAETLGSIALELFKKVDNGKEKATAHPLYNILKLQPNPLMTSVMWREMIVQDLNINGNHYSQIIRNRLDEVVSIYPLKSSSMEVSMNEAGVITYIYKAGSKKYEVAAKEILHIRGLPSNDGIKGLSPIEYNRRAIQLGDTAQEFGINFFDKGANGAGAFTTAGELSDTSYTRLKGDLAEKYAGINNSGKPMLLEGGLKFERFTIPNNDSQFLETRKYQKEDIASIFRVPMHMINSLENATFSNIEHQSLEFVQFTMLPWIKRIEQALTISLLNPIEQELYSIKFNVDTLLRGDFKTRTEGYKTLQLMGNLTINEVRALENLNSIGAAGDKRYIQMSMADIEKLGEKVKK